MDHGNVKNQTLMLPQWQRSRRQNTAGDHIPDLKGNYNTVPGLIAYIFSEHNSQLTHI